MLAALKPGTIQRWRREDSAGGESAGWLFWAATPAVARRCWNKFSARIRELPPLMNPCVRAGNSEQLAPFGAASGPSLNALDALSAAQRAHFQQRYFKSLLREGAGEPAVELLLDKNPSPTAALHLWLRMFPDLKVIIALRDPRDVIISCFFQNLMLSATNANFLSLERTARHYADLMDVWLRLRELGGFDWMEIALRRHREQPGSRRTAGDGISGTDLARQPGELP